MSDPDYDLYDQFALVCNLAICICKPGLCRWRCTGWLSLLIFSLARLHSTFECAPQLFGVSTPFTSAHAFADETGKNVDIAFSNFGYLAGHTVDDSGRKGGIVDICSLCSLHSMLQGISQGYGGIRESLSQ